MDAVDRLRSFLAELAVLREEYHLEIGGCGECGSPWVRDISRETLDVLPGGKHIGGFLYWDGEQYSFRQGSVLSGDIS